MSKLLTGLAALALSAGVAIPAAAAAPVGATTPQITSSPAQQDDLRTRLEAAIASSGLSAEDQATLRRIAAHVPSGVQHLTPRGGLARQLGDDWSQIRAHAIDPSQYDCDTTPLSDWLDTQLEDVDFGSLFLLSYIGGLDVPTYDALVYGHESKANTFGLDGSYTHELNRTMRANKRFWDVKTDDIELMPMHGKEVFDDTDRVARALWVLGWSEADAAELAPLVQEIVNEDPALDGGDHPIFTFNAFAYTNEDDPDPLAQTITDRIIVGDGILVGMKAVGLDRTAPRSILSHEFGHHVQYEDDLFDSPLTGPEATRRTELMADSFGSYFMTHKKGESANKHVVLEDERSFFEVGDCSYTSNGHHGTPNQRMRAATWGVETASAAKPRSYVMPSLDLAAAFEVKLPEFVAPDA